MNESDHTAHDRVPKPAASVQHLLFAGVLACLIVATVVMLAGGEPYAAAGNSDTGRAATLAYAFLRLVAVLAGSLTLGSLASRCSSLPRPLRGGSIPMGMRGLSLPSVPQQFG